MIRTGKLVALFLFVLPSLGLAQTIVPKLDQQGRKGEVAREAKEKAEARFKAADANGDDKLSPEEVASHQYLAENFGTLDKNKDGFLSWEEYVGHNRWPR
jgi:hypothetical protein